MDGSGRNLPTGASPALHTSVEGFAGGNHATSRSIKASSPFANVAAVKESVSPFDNLGVTEQPPVYKGIDTMRPLHAMAMPSSGSPPRSFDSLDMAVTPIDDFKSLKVGDATSLFGSKGRCESGGVLRASPEPFHLSPYTHFRCKGDIERIVDCLESTVRGMSGDITLFRRDGCLWKIELYDVSKKLEFRTQLYEFPVAVSSEEPIFTFEVQKASGCGFHFSSIFRSIHLGFVKSGLACDDLGKVMTIDDLPSPKRVRDCRKAMPGKVKACSDTFKPLVDMIRSRYVDVQLQGMQVIAQKAAVCDSSMTVLREMPGVIGLMVDLASNANVDLRRCAATVLRCFTRIEKCTRAVVSCGGLKKLVDIAKMDGSSLEEKRQAVRALKNFCHCPLLREKLRKENCAELFDSITSSTSDDRLKECAVEARKALGVN